jgi:PAS domain S-box-containing protein
VALLDPRGVIVSVNQAWKAFAAANGGDPARTGAGMSYLEVCAAAADDACTRQVDSAIRAALAGALPAPLRVEVPCHAPDVSRWFDVLISSRFDDDARCLGATVTLSITRVAPPPARPRGARGAPPTTTSPPDGAPAVPAFYAEHSERLGDAFAQLLLDRAPLGILVVDDQGKVVLAGREADVLLGAAPGGLCGRAVRELLPEPGSFDPVGPMASAAPGGGRGPVGSPRIVDAVRGDGSRVPVELRHGPVPLSRGTGSVYLLRPVPGAVPGTGTLDADELALLLSGLDRVVRHAFSSGLTVTGVADSHQAEPALADLLRGVTAELDRAVHEARAVALRLQGLVHLPGPDPTAGGGGAR